MLAYLPVVLLMKKKFQQFSPCVNSISFYIHHYLFDIGESTRMFVPCKPFQPYLQRLGYVENIIKKKNALAYLPIALFMKKMC